LPGPLARRPQQELRLYVDLDGNPPSVAVLRADRAGGDTKTPRSRRALQLAQIAAGALRE